MVNTANLSRPSYRVFCFSTKELGHHYKGLGLALLMSVMTFFYAEEKQEIFPFKIMAILELRSFLMIDTLLLCLLCLEC